MAIKASELNIILNLQQKQFSKDLARTQRQVDRMGTKFAKATKKAQRGFSGIGTAVKALAPILAGVFSVRAINSIVNNAAAISDLARVAGVTTEEFQKMSFAAKTVGIEQDKLSDLIKDTNDKIGDFLITGAGPMVDFFETIAPLVGVTADDFRNLSGPQALQLYVDSLEKANVSQAEFTFFMEAIASDATALLPLLRNGGSEFKKLGEEAKRSGNILSDEALTGAQKMRKEMQELTGSMNTLISEALLKNSDQIIDIVRTFTDEILPKVLDASEKIAQYLGGGGPPGGAKISPQQQAIDKALDDAAFANMDQGDPSSTGQFGIDANGNIFEHGTLTDDQIDSGVFDLGTHRLFPSFPSKKPKRRPIRTQRQKDEEAAKLKELNRVIDEAKTKYNDLLNSLDPLSAATFEYTKNLETLNEFERLTGQSIENKAVLVDQLKVSMQRAKQEASEFSAVADTLEQGLTDAFMSALEGANSFKDAMRLTAASVIKELYRVLVVQQLVNSAMGFLGFTQSPLGGYAFTGFQGGAHGRQMTAGKPYMTGESGRELFIPSTPGRLLSPAQTNNALGGGGPVVVNQSINVTTGVQQTVRTEIKSMMPQIAEATKGAVADAKMRGGQYKRAFN
jgi:hypothetical protein